MSRSVHRWLVDALAEGVARLEVDGAGVVTVPAWLLPADVRPGDVLRVTHEREDERSALVVERDVEATRLAWARSTAQVADIPVAGDGGGDVAL